MKFLESPYNGFPDLIHLTGLRVFRKPELAICAYAAFYPKVYSEAAYYLSCLVCKVLISRNGISKAQQLATIQTVNNTIPFVNLDENYFVPSLVRDQSAKQLAINLYTFRQSALAHQNEFRLQIAK